MIYLDNAATTKPCKEAVEAAVANMTANFGNASSLHKMGIEAEKVITAAKKTMLDRLGLEGEIFFTSGATESNNTALIGAAHAYRRRGNKIVSTAIEHPSVARVLDKLEEEGFKVVRLAPKDYPDGFEQALIDAVDKDTIIMSFMAVNNETGFTIDSRRVYNAVKRKYPNCVVHVDGVQGFCKVPLAGDFISVSSHKIHGIKGLGALYQAKNVRFLPLMQGGGQQKNLRSGTEPVDLIAAFAAAVSAYPKATEHFSLLKEHLLSRLTELEGVTVNSANSVPAIVNFSLAGIRSEIMLHFLEESEIYISSGSACSKGKVSPVLAALGVTDKNADSALRVSFCRDNTTDEIDRLIEQLKAGIARFRR